MSDSLDRNARVGRQMAHAARAVGILAVAAAFMAVLAGYCLLAVAHPMVGVALMGALVAPLATYTAWDATR